MAPASKKQGGRQLCGPCAVLKKEVVFRLKHTCPCKDMKSEFQTSTEVWQPVKVAHKGKFDCVFWIKWLYKTSPNTFVFKGDTKEYLGLV